MGTVTEIKAQPHQSDRPDCQPVDATFLLFRKQFEAQQATRPKPLTPQELARRLEEEDEGVPAGARITALVYGVIAVCVITLIALVSAASHAWGG